jgi:thioredoxin reductase (NADPH)
MTQEIYPIAVIGGGSAGIMATLRGVLNNDDVLLFPGSPKDKKKSRALWVKKIENMPAHFQYKRGIEEPNLETLKWIEASAFASKLHLKKNTGVIDIVKNADGIFELTDSKGEVSKAKYVILCTGVMDVQPEISGSIETVFDYANAQTIDYCLRCDGHHTLGKKTVILGHDKGAAWSAIQLFERYQQPQMIILTNGKKADYAEDVKELLQKYKIETYEEVISGIIGENKGQTLEGFTLANGKVIEAQMCFVSLGMLVYNELAKKLSAELDARGFVVADESGLSSVSGLYVAGDLKANAKKQIYTAWDQAVNAADAINQKLRIEKRKSP